MSLIWLQGILTDGFSGYYIYVSRSRSTIWTRRPASQPLCSMAGFETSAQTLAYAIWELARNQDMQDRLRCEISQFGGRELIHEELQSKLPYMDAVLRETYVGVLTLAPADVPELMSIPQRAFASGTSIHGETGD